MATPKTADHTHPELDHGECLTKQDVLDLMLKALQKNCFDAALIDEEPKHEPVITEVDGVVVAIDGEPPAPEADSDYDSEA